MNTHPFTVAHIPARSGSTRLEDKNVLPLNGHPLLAYTVRMAALLPGIDMVLVNTDSQRYADIAMEYGARIPCLRPPELARTNSSLQATWDFAKELVRKEVQPVERVVHLLPTSPFRNLATCAKLLSELGHFFKVTTAYWSDGRPDTTLIRHDSDYISLKSIMNTEFHQAYRWMKPLSYFVGIWEQVNGNDLCYYNNFGYYFLNNPIEAIDIDTKEDFEVAVEVLNNGLYDFGADLWAS